MIPSFNEFAEMNKRNTKQAEPDARSRFMEYAGGCDELLKIERNIKIFANKYRIHGRVCPLNAWEKQYRPEVMKATEYLAKERREPTLDLRHAVAGYLHSLMPECKYGQKDCGKERVN